ncbi:MAG TPA: cytochrome c biogenesis protein CcdA [Candidatus Saccharimonadales bacterium]
MELLVVSFVAGILTVLAPCTLPFLPILLSGVAADEKDWHKPFTIVIGLAGSIFIFTFLLKVSTGLLGVPLMFWQVTSGGILVLFGLVMLLPGIWEQAGARLSPRSNNWLSGAMKKKGMGGDLLIGAALGPVFSSCSPTYALILASVLPVTPAVGVVYLLAYVIGLAAILLLIAFAGQRVIAMLRPASNPHGWFKRSLGIVFLLVGVMIVFGLDKKLQTFVLEQGWYDPISNFEQQFMR